VGNVPTPALTVYEKREKTNLAAGADNSAVTLPRGVGWYYARIPRSVNKEEGFAI
jgi:hypothetical protein